MLDAVRPTSSGIRVRCSYGWLDLVIMSFRTSRNNDIAVASVKKTDDRSMIYILATVGESSVILLHPAQDPGWAANISTRECQQLLKGERGAADCQNLLKGGGEGAAE